MTDIDPRLEAACRAACIAEGVDPDDDGYGMGATMPAGSRYKLWEQRIRPMRAGLLEWLQQKPTVAMRMEAERRPAGYISPAEDADASGCYTVMCAQAAKEIGG